MKEFIKLHYHASIIKGQLFIPNRAEMKNDFLAIGDCEDVTMTLEPTSEGKSNAQIRTFHGPIVGQVQAFEMATNGVYKNADRVKHELKEQFLPKQKRYWTDGSPVIIKIQHPERKGVFMEWHMEEVPSLADLTKNQMRGFFDAIMDFYLHTHGLDIQIDGHDFPDGEKGK